MFSGIISKQKKSHSEDFLEFMDELQCFKFLMFIEKLFVGFCVLQFCWFKLLRHILKNCARETQKWSKIGWINQKNHRFVVFAFYKISSFIRLTLFAVTVSRLLLRVIGSYLSYSSVIDYFSKEIAFNRFGFNNESLCFSMNSYWFPCFLGYSCLSCLVMFEAFCWLR